MGIVFLHVWMQVVNMMEKALDNCAQSGEGLEEWDEAVAFYVGSLEGSGGAGEGVLLYDLADKRCGDFNTCGKNGNSILGTSYVNIEVINRFKAGQRNVQESDCVAARGDKEHIVQLMLIPLIQGTLRYAHLQGTGVDTGEKANAEGGVFAAAVLPHVYACVKEDAEIIFESMGAGHTKATDFSAVKAALERNYQCMGITCAEVGGLWDSVEEKYFPQSEPCGSGKRKKNGSSTNVNGVDNPGLAIGLAVGAAAVLFIIVILSNFCGKKAAPPVSVAPQNDAQLT